jgi:hypothetical protein
MLNGNRNEVIDDHDMFEDQAEKMLNGYTAQ